MVIHTTFYRTPLIAAAMEGHEGVVKVLLHYGADKEMKDKEGWKAIDHAAMTGNHKLVKVKIICTLESHFIHLHFRKR